MFLNNVLALVPSVDKQLKLLLEQQEKLKPIVKPIKNMYDAKNTLKTPIIDMGNNDIVNGAEAFFKATDFIINYITHPTLIVNAIASASYWICGLFCIAGILYYIIGHKKGVRWASGSLLGYTLIQVVNYAVSL